MAFEYTRLETGDGSPTLKLSADGEAMHAMEGAFTETQYIYQPTVEKAFINVQNPSFLSVGLGLGYNEILIACEALKSSKPLSLIQSYESVAELRQAFSDWLNLKPNTLSSVYDDIASKYSKHYQLPVDLIQKKLKNLLDEKKLVLAEAIETSTVPPASHAVLFDAFSSKTSPHLWSEDFLNQFFANTATGICFVSTYACTGALKRALKLNGFILEIKKGFGVKRESTFAAKNL